MLLITHISTIDTVAIIGPEAWDKHVLQPDPHRFIQHLDHAASASAGAPDLWATTPGRILLALDTCDVKILDAETGEAICVAGRGGSVELLCTWGPLKSGTSSIKPMSHPSSTVRVPWSVWVHGGSHRPGAPCGFGECGVLGKVPLRAPSMEETQRLTAFESRETHETNHARWSTEPRQKAYPTPRRWSRHPDSKSLERAWYIWYRRLEI